ncbi:hypothetical protein [Candidatus Pelagibacter sp. HIMB1495]|uniref:hypothetical protein n=1 Tax=unclassified Candidatus Pelagibacter TaxID=2647897 RepID=UPI003F8456BD
MVFKLLLIIAYSNFFFISSAQAYIDPGTISIIFQAIVGAIVAGGVALKMYWHKFKTLFSKKKKDNSDQELDK